MEQWKKCKLGDVLNFRRGHDLPKTKMKPGNVPVAGSNGIIGYHDEATPVSPCITIGRSGNVGTPYIYNHCWAHNTVLYVDDFKGNDPYYLYYLLKSLPLSSFGGGSAVPTLNRNHIHPLEIKYTPNLITQRKIVSILKSIDDKIEVNRKINSNLEEQAKALFKSWFIDFDPFKDGKFIDSELGIIPEGWEVKHIEEITENIKERVGERKDIRVLSPITTGYLVLSEDYFSKQVFSESIAKYIIVHPHDFAYNPARVNIGSLGMNEFDFDGCVSPVYVVFRCQSGYEYFFDLFRRTSFFTEEVKKRAIGGVRQTLNYKDLSLIKLVYPPRDIVEAFNEIYLSLLREKHANNMSNDSLSSLRDNLLPRLMSGELSV